MKYIIILLIAAITIQSCKKVKCPVYNNGTVYATQSDTSIIIHNESNYKAFIYTIVLMNDTLDLAASLNLEYIDTNKSFVMHKTSWRGTINDIPYTYLNSPVHFTNYKLVYAYNTTGIDENCRGKDSISTNF